MSVIAWVEVGDSSAGNHGEEELIKVPVTAWVKVPDSSAGSHGTDKVLSLACGDTRGE